jgi:hypothetical protein
MLFQLIGANVPPLDGMALGAIRSELAAVNIGMAAGTIAAYVLEHQIRVALRAGHLFVHASKRVASAVVIELRNTTNGLPARIRVAVFAGDADGAVWIAAVLLLRLGSGGTLPKSESHQQPEQQRE